MQETLSLAPDPTATLRFFVPGKPATAGNKSAFPFKRPDGSLGVRVTEGRTGASRDRARSWRDDLRSSAIAATEREGGWELPPKGRAIKLTVVIVRARPSTHTGTGANAGLVKARVIDRRPVERPDSIKLVRAIEDALTGILWIDDSAITEHIISKVFGDQIPGGAITDEGAHVRVDVL